MKRPVEVVLAILCMVSLYRPFSGETSMLESVGYVLMALLSAALILVLHLRPNQTGEWIQPQDEVVEVRSGTGQLATKK